MILPVSLSYCCSVRCELIKLVQDELTILRMLSLSYAEPEEMNEQLAVHATGAPLNQRIRSQDNITPLPAV